MNGFPFLDILIFAVIAVFLVMKLRSTLGKRTGYDEPLDTQGQYSRDEDNVINLPKREQEERESDSRDDGDTVVKPAKEIRAGAVHHGKEDEDVIPADSALAAGLTQIELADRNFDTKGFMRGANAAFEMVVSSYATGDKKTLRNLLADDVYNDFAQAIDDRNARGHTHETVLVGVSDADIIEAELRNKTAVVSVKFVSEQVNVTRDAEGEVVEGDPNHVAKVTDIWTFARDTRSKDPNWALVETRSPN